MFIFALTTILFSCHPSSREPLSHEDGFSFSDSVSHDFVVQAANSHDAESLNLFLSTLEPEHRFLSIFYIGETQFSSASMEEIAHVAAELEEQYQFDFYDGVAYGYDWSIQPPDDLIAAIQTFVPNHYQERLINGLLMSVVMDSNGDLEVIQETILQFKQRFPNEHLLDGLRVGLQRRLGHQPKPALQLALALDEGYQLAILEELGWRVGTDFLAQFVKEPWDMDMSEEKRCIYRHGIARGLTQDYLDRGHLEKAVQKTQILAPTCSQAVWQGVGSAMRIHHFSLAKFWVYTAALTVEERTWVQRGYDRLERFHMWDLGLE